VSLDGCEECRRMKAGLAAYDEALEHPGRFEKDPLPVQQAILAAARAKAAEYRAANEAKPDGRASLDPPRAGGPRVFLLAAAVLLLVGAGFVIGRLTAPDRTIIKYEEVHTVGIDSSTRGRRDR
jgi:hypothetical protein